MRPGQVIRTTATHPHPLTGTSQLGPYEAVLPTISGRGQITGFHTIGDIWGQFVTDVVFGTPCGGSDASTS